MKFLNNLDLQQNELQNFRVQNLAVAPANPVIGQHYFNTVDNTEYVWNGTKWIDALSQGDYTFKNGITVDENRNVMLTAADADNIGGVTIGDNIDVAAGKISVKTAAEGVKGLIALASDEEATAGTDIEKAINAKQLKAVKDAADNAVAAEKTRAEEKEKANATAIADEAKRADTAEKKIAADLAKEVTDARAAEKTLTDNLAAEVKRAGDKETELEGKIGDNTTAIEAEVTRATAEEGKLDKAIKDEAARADKAEKANATAITGLDTRLTANEELANKNKADLATEVERAGKAEKANADAITADKQDLATFKQTVADTYVPLAQKGVANGIATLDNNGLVPAAQLPSYVDDVVDLVAIGTAPATAKVGEKYYNTTEKKIYVATAENTWGNAADPEADKIYVNIADNMSYRWSGTTLVQIGADKLKGFNGTIVGDGAKTTFDINHNLGTRNVVFEIYEAATPYEKVYVQVLHTSTTALQVVFSQAPAVGTDYNVTVVAIA